MEFLEKVLGFSSPELTGHDPNAEYASMFCCYSYYTERKLFEQEDALIFYKITLASHRYGYEVP